MHLFRAAERRYSEGSKSPSTAVDKAGSVGGKVTVRQSRLCEKKAQRATVKLFTELPLVVLDGVRRYRRDQRERCTPHGRGDSVKVSAGARSRPVLKKTPTKRTLRRRNWIFNNLYRCLPQFGLTPKVLKYRHAKDCPVMPGVVQLGKDMRKLSDDYPRHCCWAIECSTGQDRVRIQRDRKRDRRLLIRGLVEFGRSVFLLLQPPRVLEGLTKQKAWVEGIPSGRARAKLLSRKCDRKIKDNVGRVRRRKVSPKSGMRRALLKAIPALRDVKVVVPGTSLSVPKRPFVRPVLNWAPVSDGIVRERETEVSRFE